MTIRILQVVSQMNRAGIETWLMHVLRDIDRQQYKFDFLVHGQRPADYDAEILALGSRIFRCVPIQKIWQYGRSIRQTLRSAPRYDIIHVHRDYFSGFPLRCGEQVGIPIRIAHSHNDQRNSFAKLRWSVKSVASISKALIPRHATHGLAASELAAETLYGANWHSDSRWDVLPCGLDLSRSTPVEKSVELRREFGIPDDAIVIGHVGRISVQKNQLKILEIADALTRIHDRFRVVLVGRGPLQSAVELEIARRGLGQHVILAGVRDDVPHLFAGLFDVLLFPSQFEGLGLAIVESLAAGCPAVISDVVPQEADIVKRLVTRIPLDVSPETWASAVLCQATANRSLRDRFEAHQQVVQSPYNLKTCIARLTALYDRAVGEVGHSSQIPASA